MEITIGIIVGLIVGALVGVLFMRGQKSGDEAEKKAQKAEIERLTTELQRQKEEFINNQHKLELELEGTREDYRVAQTDYEVCRAKLEEYDARRVEQEERHERELAALRTNHSEELQRLSTHHERLIEAQEMRHDEALLAMKERFEQTINELHTSMKAATEDMLRSRQQEFSVSAQTGIKNIVDPLNETIAKMKAAMDGYSKEQSDFGGFMKANIDTIVRQTEAAQRSATELTTALKHDSKIQGDYGEAILDEILSSQGFTEGVHYELQYTIRDAEGRTVKGEDGSMMRPDVVFHLDRVRDVIIDSKVNLTDFIAFANAETPDERRQALDRHVASIRNQIRLLSQKNYAKYHDKTHGRMDYVIMFVPISAAWWEALRREPALWREAMEQKVYIADEQTLFAALSIIRLTWTQIAQVENQQQVFNLATEMVDRVGQFMKQYKSIGSSLGAAVEAYTKAEKKLLPGGQSILKTADKLLKIGCQDSKTNPVSKFLDVDDIEELPELD